MGLARFGIIPIKHDWSCPICEYINRGRDKLCWYCRKGIRPIKDREE